MKMKKNKLSNFLKTGTLLFGISIFLWNCDKENSETILNNQRTISIEQVQKQFKSTYNESAFSKRLPSPNWVENKTFYNNEGNQYLEIPFQTINQEDIEKGTSVSFDKLIATSINNKIELKIVHFFGIDIKDNFVDFNSISHTELYNFSGFVTEYDLNKNVLGIKQYNKGKDTENEIFLKTKSKEENSIFARADESTWEYTETICTRGCWYWEYTDGSRENISCSPYSCTTTTYSGGNFGGGGNGSNGHNTSYNTNENTECASGYTRNVDGKCMIDEQIINNLTGKADCVYGKMVSNNNNINWILENFEDGNQPSEFDLIFEMSTSLGNETNASTVKSGNTFTISINENTLPNRTSLGLARTIIHEGIHARLREFASRDGSNAVNFPGVYDYFRIYKKNWDHQQMADYYRSTIAKGLKQYDNSQHSDQFYNDMSWEGLANIKDANGVHNQIYTEAWKKLTTSEKNRIKNTITNEKDNGNKTCQ